MSENPLLKTPGEMISEARESQDLTIGQLSERTKIPPAVLAALELDEYHKISGPLYIKSFLRTCAVDLGLDPQVVLSLYNKISGDPKSGSIGSEMVWEDEEVKISRVGLPWLRIIMGAGVVAVLAGLGLFALRGCGGGQSARDEEPHAAVDRTLSAETTTAAVHGDTATDGDIRHESLIPPRTEADLRQRATVAEDLSAGRDEGGGTEPSPRDTLALGWMLNPEPPVEENDPSKAPVLEAELPTEDDSAEEETPTEESVMVADDPVQEDKETVEEAPLVTTVTQAAIEPEVIEPEVIEPEESEPEVIVTGDRQEVSSVVARMDSSWPLVLGISCDAPQEILVKRDGDRNFSQVQWPGELETAPDLPAAGFEAGRAYRQGDRLVVFWGAEDHFSLKVARVRGVEVSINGLVWDVEKLHPGQEHILDAHSVGSTPRR